ncbi:uncharacterized protein LOC122277621 isoform X2 [Carya illinoinensis]|uniref:Uncharacterized protein n=2 Tax=Carya illinoinensis TaxID=32201 RepID=A0A8T1PKM9_CARIL|nr:uncharacterized protein LOC122277621 isoform X2 [Carya illinoinensis]KAG6641612.1 hypothetical protein CIPAW_09G086700 [Carya illinoinensis]
MADNPKLVVCGLEENMGRQEISVSDHINGFQYSADKSDSFVIDMESLSHGGANKEITANPRITLQRSLSRKGSQRVGEKKIIPMTTAAAADRDPALATSSPRAAMVGSSTAEKSMAVGTIDNPSSPQLHHQITITTGININTPTESRCISRRNSFRRSPWVLDPKKILFLFATLSSMGTILLIYFTLSIAKLDAKEDGLDWQH